MKEKKRILVIEPGGGLCNRLICINNALNLYRRMINLDIRIAWWKEPECGCTYEDVLKPIEGITVKNFSRPLKTRKMLIKERKYIALLVSFGQKIFWEYYYRTKNKSRIGSFWNDGGCTTEEKLISEIKAYNMGATIFHRMGAEYRTDCILTENFFSERVITELNKMRKMLDDKKYIGIHIRRTDHKQAIENSPTEFFIDAIARELEISKEACFYLATDDSKVEDELINLYRNCILCNRNGSKDRISAKAIQDAAVDLLMLAGAERIYGSIGSTFSEMAAQIGKKPLILKID